MCLSSGYGTPQEKFVNLIKNIDQVRIDIALVEVVKMFTGVVKVRCKFNAHVAPVPRLKDVVRIALRIGECKAILMRVV